ncbi:hypothetical protein AAMO2058_000687500 [Amorphochlora amoebiformis]
MFTSPTAESLRACSSRTISSIGRNASDKTSPTDSPKVTTEKRGSRRASLLRNKRISASKKNLLGSPKDTTGKLEGRPKLFPSRTSSSIRDLMQARKNSYLEKEVSAVSGSAISGSSAISEIVVIKDEGIPFRYKWKSIYVVENSVYVFMALFLHMIVSLVINNYFWANYMYQFFSAFFATASTLIIGLRVHAPDVYVNGKYFSLPWIFLYASINGILNAYAWTRSPQDSIGLKSLVALIYLVQAVTIHIVFPVWLFTDKRGPRFKCGHKAHMFNFLFFTMNIITTFQYAFRIMGFTNLGLVVAIGILIWGAALVVCVSFFRNNPRFRETDIVRTFLTQAVSLFPTLYGAIIEFILREFGPFPTFLSLHFGIWIVHFLLQPLLKGGVNDEATELIYAPLYFYQETYTGVLFAESNPTQVQYWLLFSWILVEDLIIDTGLFDEWCYDRFTAVKDGKTDDTGLDNKAKKLQHIAQVYREARIRTYVENTTTTCFVALVVWERAVLYNLGYAVILHGRSEHDANLIVAGEVLMLAMEIFAGVATSYFLERRMLRVFRDATSQKDPIELAPLPEEDNKSSRTSARCDSKNDRSSQTSGRDDSKLSRSGRILRNAKASMADVDVSKHSFPEILEPTKDSNEVKESEKESETSPVALKDFVAPKRVFMSFTSVASHSIYVTLLRLQIVITLTILR